MMEVPEFVLGGTDETNPVEFTVATLVLLLDQVPVIDPKPKDGLVTLS
jgi:hypothetical protein